VSFAAITLCVASQRVFIVVSVYFVIDSVRKLLDTPSYNSPHSQLSQCSRSFAYFQYPMLFFRRVGSTGEWVPEDLSPRIKRPGREADHSPPRSAEVKNEWSYTSTHQYVFMAWCLVKYRIHPHGMLLR
jgi:hypothetical protein